jgi:uncharacterized membrane protein (UPF0127 family)
MAQPNQDSSPDNNDQSHHTAQHIVVLALLAVLVLVLSALVFSYLPDKTLKIGEQIVSVEVVDTPAEREQGLSGRESLGRNQGMLFVFSEPSQYCLWMKDMKFSIDMIWFDKDKKVVHVQQNATPESYPESFCSPVNAKYIVEVAAGSVQKWGVNPGDQAAF